MSKSYDLNGIPDEMKLLRGWLYWVGNKVPKTLRRDPATNKCNHNNPACLSRLEEVLHRIRHFTSKHGLAFSFQREFGLTYIDLDDCHNPDTGELTGFASSVVERLDSYTEISIGRKGLHIVCRGQVPRPRLHTKRRWSGRQIEIKPFGFYMTVSGDQLHGTPLIIQERQSELTVPYEEIFGDEPKPVKRRPEKNKREVRADNGLDLSACEFAICCELAKAGLNYDEIERALIADPIMNRRKWRERRDYRNKTILAALKYVLRHA